MSYSMSVTSVSSNAGDMRVQLASAVEKETAVVEVLNGPSLAPSGRHVMSVSVHHASYSLRAGWGDEQRNALGDLVERQLSRCFPGFLDRVVGRRVLTPTDLESEFGVTGGSLNHGELALDQFLFMRPVPTCARYATPLRGLWLCGAGTHPASTSGAGGLLAAREILERGNDR